MKGSLMKFKSAQFIGRLNLKFLHGGEKGGMTHFRGLCHVALKNFISPKVLMKKNTFSVKKEMLLN